MRRLVPLVVALAACRSGNCGAVCSFDAEAHPALTVGAGDWQVVPAPDAPSPPNVLAQEASNADAVFNVALFDFDAVSRRDLELSVRLKAIAGDIDRGGGLVWRAKDVRNYYVARFNPLESNLRVYKVVDGARTELASADAEASPGWHKLRVRMVGDAIACELDGKIRIGLKDGTFPEAGKIGLWTKADARTQFDDVFLVTP